VGAEFLKRYWRHCVIGVAVLLLASLWSTRVARIRRLGGEIARLEVRLSEGQALAQRHPPLTPAEKKELQSSYDRLWTRLPQEKDLPSLLQEISRLGRNHSLGDLSFKTDGANPAGTPAPASPSVTPKPKIERESGPIVAFPARITFAGEYREIAYFLEALQALPRLVTVESIKLERALPLVTGEVVVHGYYRKGELRTAGQ
jgi:Tfp pilus assembly protein PilO